MLVATALVLLMTPALAFFYGGLVRSKNALNTMMMSVVALGVVGLAWAAARLLAGLRSGRPLRRRLSTRSCAASASRPQGTIPHLLFMSYQGTFAIITAALISGAIVERMRFRPVPRLHHALEPRSSTRRSRTGSGAAASCARLGALDFAGGTVVHVNAGAAALVAAFVLGPAQGLRAPGAPAAQRPLRAARRGPALVRLVRLQRRQRARRHGSAALAFANTMLAPPATLVVWTLLDLKRTGKVTAVGAATGDRRRPGGDHAGRRVREPAAAPCARRDRRVPSYFGLLFRARTRLDDSLDVVAAHGLGGTVGALLTGVFAEKAWGTRPTACSSATPASSASRRSRCWSRSSTAAR